MKETESGGTGVLSIRTFAYAIECRDSCSFTMYARLPQELFPKSFLNKMTRSTKQVLVLEPSVIADR